MRFRKKVRVSTRFNKSRCVTKRGRPMVSVPAQFISFVHMLIPVTKSSAAPRNRRMGVCKGRIND